MHLVVNTLSVTPNRGGVKTYLLNLLNALLAREERKRITLLCSEQNKQLFTRHNREWACVEREVLPLRGDQPALRILFDQVVVPLYCRQYPDAVLLSQASTSSLAASLPEVVIVQVPLSVRSIRSAVPPEADNTLWRQRLYYDTMLPLTLWRADEVVAVSDHLRREIANLYPRFARKVRTVHEGVNLDSFRIHTQAERREKPEVPYLLFVSTLFPYKRADQAVRAFARVINREGRKDLRLKLAGKDPGEESQRLKQIAHDHGVYDRVDVLGVVSHDEMPKLYRGAEAFLFPSTVETFGLPVLEAMACGTPVIASDRMSVPEIVGDAGLIVDPDDTSALTDAICRLLEDESLWEELREAGKERAQHFTWERTARGVWKALEDAKESATT
jgi:glycosyltransferase involved in cell wall biosynthesis